MRLAETDLTRIRIPLSILDQDGNLFPGFVPAAHELQTSKSGSAFADAAGTLVEIGNGAYYYQGVLADALVEGFLAVGINRPNFRGFSWRPVVGGAGLTIFPFFITNGGLLQPGCNPSNPGELQMSLDGAAWANATGTFGELGLGYYYYRHNVPFIDTPVIVKVVKAGFDEALAWGSSTVAVNAVLLSVVPTDGSLLSPDPEVARWTPVSAVMQMSPPTVPLIFATIGTMHWMVFDGTQFTPFFAEHSTFSNVSGVWSFSILPNGGWWRSNIQVTYAAGTVLAA